MNKFNSYFKREKDIPFGASTLLSIFEGIEGGFAISSSVMLGLLFANLDSKLALIVTAVISIVVNGFNSAAVKYTSQHYMDEVDGKEDKQPHNYLAPSIIQFTSYTIISILCVLPVIFIDNTQMGVFITCGATLLVLFIAGVVRGAILESKSLRDGLETTLMGAGIMVVGLVSGIITNILL